MKSIFAYLMESESKLLARFFAVLFSTASYPGPDALSLVAASADALCLGTYFSCKVSTDGRESPCASDRDRARNSPANEVKTE